MFEIKPADSESPDGSKLMVVDKGRNAWFQSIGGMGSSPGSVFKLVWKGMDIAFDIHPEPHRDDEGGSYVILHFGGFGRDTDQHQGNISRWLPTSDEERHEAKILAVEALLAYGSVYDGHKHPNGRYRIKLDDCVYIKSDFGLP